MQRYAKSTVFTHTSWFLSYPNQWLLDLEHEPKQLEASPPQQSGLQLESASLNQEVTTGVISCVKTKPKLELLLLRNYNGNFILTHTVCPEIKNLEETLYYGLERLILWGRSEAQPFCSSRKA